MVATGFLIWAIAMVSLPALAADGGEPVHVRVLHADPGLATRLEGMGFDVTLSLDNRLELLARDRDLDRLRALIHQTPDMTLAELAEALNNKVSVPTVWRATQKLGLPFKKSLFMRPNRTGRMSSKHARRGSTNSHR